MYGRILWRAGACFLLIFFFFFDRVFIRNLHFVTTFFIYLYHLSLSYLFSTAPSRPLGGRHAAVIPALPEEYDTSISLSAFLPERLKQQQREKQQMNAANASSPRGLAHYPQHVVAQALQQQQAQTQTPIQLGQQQQQQLSILPGPSAAAAGSGSPLPASSFGAVPALMAMPTGGRGGTLHVKEYRPPVAAGTQASTAPSNMAAGTAVGGSVKVGKRVTRSSANVATRNGMFRSWK